MAQICTPNNRPQLATVRYKVMDSAKRLDKPFGKLNVCDINPDKLGSGTKIISVEKKPKVESIESAEIIVVAGRGAANAASIELVKKLADSLGGTYACTRPLVESGAMPANRQIGLSGRTVRPKLIITCGVSGAVQFTAGMKGADTIVAINTDKNAAIFNVAHYGLVGDLNEIIPSLIAKIENGGTM
jgi:electron transfer flavoprotein alpha subunit